MHDEDDAYDPCEYDLIPDPRTILRQGCTVKLVNDLLFRSVVVSVNYVLADDFGRLRRMSGKNRARRTRLFRQGQANLIDFIKVNESEEMLEYVTEKWADRGYP